MSGFRKIFVTEFLLISWRNVQFGNSSDLRDDGKGDEHLLLPAVTAALRCLAGSLLPAICYSDLQYRVPSEEQKAIHYKVFFCLFMRPNPHGWYALRPFDIFRCCT